MNSYIEKVLEEVCQKNATEPEFVQAVKEVVKSIAPVITSEHEAAALLERMVEPERIITFRVPWVDDSGKVQVNRGYRVQFNGSSLKSKTF